MKTQEEIKSEMLSQELTKRGIENHFSISSTDYGTSCYFTFYKNKDSIEKMVVRISDHSVSNYSRMTTERHERAENINIERTALIVDLYLNPETFVFVPSNKNITHRLNGVCGTYEKINK